MAEVLPIAMGHRDDLRADGDELAARLLLACATSAANGERYWVARASVLSTLAEDVASHREQRVVIKLSAVTVQGSRKSSGLLHK